MAMTTNTMLTGLALGLRQDRHPCCVNRNLPQIEQADWFSWRQKRGVVIAGRMTAEEGRQVAEWAELLGWPLIGDTATANRVLC